MVKDPFFILQRMCLPTASRICQVFRPQNPYRPLIMLQDSGAFDLRPSAPGYCGYGVLSFAWVQGLRQFGNGQTSRCHADGSYDQDTDPMMDVV